MSEVPAPLEGLLGPGAHHEGDLTLDGRFVVQGTLVGDVRCGDLVEVAPGGRVEGVVDAAQILVGGEVEGTLLARERITLLETARVRGEVATPWLDVRCGARIEARVDVRRGEETGYTPTE